VKLAGASWIIQAAPEGAQNASPGLDREGARPTPTAPRTPAEHHYDLAESGLADLGRVGFDDAGRTVEVLVALTNATSGDRRESRKRRLPAEIVGPTHRRAPYRFIRAGRFLPYES